MNHADLARLRLNAQHIATADFEAPDAVVQHLLALQAQDYPGALWAVGLRTARCTQADVERAIAERKIVRTWPMRGTLHLLHASDVRWMVALLAPRATAAAKGRCLALGLTDTVIAQVEAVVRTALAGGIAMRRDALGLLLREKVTGVAIANEQFGHILRNFGERGVICFGPHEGKQPTFVLLDDWLPPSAPRDRSDALGELAQRYFVSHGPATLLDFSGWANLTLRDARLGLELASPELESAVVSGTTYYYKPGLEPARDSQAYLLPGFDEFMLGYKDRSAALTPVHSNKIVPGNNGMFLATMVLDGQVVGTWKKQVRKGGVTMEYIGFETGLHSNGADFAVAAQRYSQFIGC